MSIAPPPGERERRLLLLGARLEPSAGQAREIEELAASDLDWESVLFHARLHSVACLLHRHLKRYVDPDRLPGPVMAGFLGASHAAEYRNRLFAVENARLLDGFAAAAIPAIVPKGIALLDEIYGSPALRPLIDLIFLVPSERRRDVRAMFERLGYREKPPRPVDGLYRWSCPQFLFETVGAMRVQVLVLWHLVTWPRPHFWTMDGVWARARPLALSGRSARALSPEDQVLYLCLQVDNHAAFNRAALGTLSPEDLLFALWSNNRIIRFTDVYETVRRHRAQFRWDQLVERTRSAGIEGAALASLRLTNALLGATAAEEILDELTGAVSGRVGRWFAQTLVPELRTGPVSRLRETVATRLRALKPYWQVRLFRFIGLAELAFPGAAALRRKYRVRSRAAVGVLAVLHSGAAILRALGSFLFLSVAKRTAALGKGA